MRLIGLKIDRLVPACFGSGCWAQGLGRLAHQMEMCHGEDTEGVDNEV